MIAYYKRRDQKQMKMNDGSESNSSQSVSRHSEI